MAERAGFDGRLPLTVRVIERSPTGPIRTGLAIAAVLVIGFGIFEWALGRHELVEGSSSLDLRNIRLTFVLILAFAAGASGFVAVAQGAKRTFEQLKPLLAGSTEELTALERAAGVFPARGLRASGWLGVAIFVLIPIAVEPDLRTWDPRWWPAEVYWHRALLPFVGWYLGRILYAQIEESRRLSRLATRLASIDLFELDGLDPFARQGLLHALMSIVFLAITSLLLLEWGFAPVFALLAFVSVGVGVMSLVLSVTGVRSRIREAKRGELERCADALRRLRSGDPVTEDPSKLAGVTDLLAYRERVERVGESTLDVSVLGRFGFYLLIPLISWIGSVLLEGLIDRLLE